tara:strand:+ start:599 stop:862 length:264 start_codon:yes stop_codon:yes gene_type:complete
MNFYKKLKTNSPQSMNKFSPEHYQTGIETWDYIAAQELDYFLGNVCKYISRAGRKPGEDAMDDLLKARAYLTKKIQLLQRTIDDTAA